MRVDAIRNDLGVDAVVGEDSAHGAGAAMVQAQHAVEGMRPLQQTMIRRLDHLLVAGSAVGHCEFYTFGDTSIDEGQ